MSLDADQFLFHEGDAADAMFVVLDGAVQVVTTDDAGHEVVLARVEAGEHFGEQALLPGSTGRRSASVRAAIPSHLARVPKPAFIAVLRKDDALRERLVAVGDEQVRIALERISALARVLDLEKWPLARRVLADGEVLFRAGDEADALYLIRSGRLAVYGGEAPASKLLGRIGRGGCVGEVALVRHEKRAATVVAEDETEVVAVARDVFDTMYRRSEAFREHLETLSWIYELPSRGLLIQGTGKFLGEDCITTLYRVTEGKSFTSHRVIGQDIYAVELLGTEGVERGPDTLRFEHPTDGRSRELGISPDQTVTGLIAKGFWPDAGELHLFILEGRTFGVEERKQFLRSGCLREVNRPASEAPSDLVCRCVGVSSERLHAAIGQGCTTFDRLQRETRCGTVCGGCVPSVVELLGEVRWTEADVVSERDEAPGIRSFELAPRDARYPLAQPGQHVIVEGIVAGMRVRRPYTASAATRNDRRIRITVKREQQGLFSPWLFDQRPRGTPLRITHPRGDFVLDAGGLPLVCLVAGIGITPALAAAHAVADGRLSTPLSIHYSGRSRAQMACATELEQMALRHRNISVVIRETARHGHVGAGEITSLARSLPNGHFYLCGPAAYLADVNRSLKQAGVPDERIHSETFTPCGAPPAPRIMEPERAEPRTRSVALGRLDSNPGGLGTSTGGGETSSTQGPQRDEGVPIEQSSETGTLSASEVAMLAAVPILADDRRRQAVLARSTVRSVAQGEVVLAEGAPATAFYVVVAGELEVTVAAAAGPRVIATLNAGDWFGEEALLRGGPRTATVRALAPTRCVEVPRAAFDEEVLSSVVVRRALLHTADVRLAERSLRSLAFFSDLDLDEELDGVMLRREFAAGTVVFSAGTAAETMGFVLDGVARVVPGEGPSGPARMRLGPGQCVGEQDVLNRQPRADTVVAETPLTLLEVRAERFRAWLQRNEELADWVGTLGQIYRLGDGRMLTVYQAVVDGWPSVVTLHGDPSNDGVTTTDRVGQDYWVIARCRNGAGVAETVRFAEGARARALGLVDVVRNDRGAVCGGRLVRVEVQCTGPDVGQLYRRLLLGDQITARDLERFRRTGYLGGSTRASEGRLLCQCLQIRPEEIVAASSVESVQRETGAGMVCGGCRPKIEALVARHAKGPSVELPRVGKLEPCEVPEVRPAVFEFAREAIERIRGVPEMHLAAVTSVLSTPAERMIITAVGEAAPRLASPDLAAAVEAFLAQEANHITAHAPLNAMLLHEVYPYSKRLRRLGEQMLVRYGALPLVERLAIGAAYEYASDSIFAAVFEAHYREGRRFHRDPAVHQALVESGIGPLFSWHALEELSHRHVAFEVAVALGVERPTLRLGMTRVLADLARLQFPALMELVHHERGTNLVRFSSAVFVDPGFVRIFALRLLRWMRADFDPGKTDYAFQQSLESDVEALIAELEEPALD